MVHTVYEDPQREGRWLVTAIGADGEIYRTAFTHTDAKLRAQAYAEWMNLSQPDPDEPDGGIHESLRPAA